MTRAKLRRFDFDDNTYKLTSAYPAAQAIGIQWLIARPGAQIHTRAHTHARKHARAAARTHTHTATNTT